MSTTPVIPTSGSPGSAVASPLAAEGTVLSPNNPTVTSEEPSVSVTVPNTSGTVTFQLIVTDNLGVQSAPVTATVTIQGAPTAVLNATPSTVGPGQTITLDGSRSFATDPGKLSTFNFTLITPTTGTPIVETPNS